jgi:hypothetical protein
MDGFFFLTSMMSVIMVLMVGGVLVFVFVKVAGASGGAGKAAVASMADPVAGVFVVTAAAMPSRTALYHMTRITGVVSGEGVEPTAAQYSGLIKTANWPSPGASLPVVVDRANPKNFAIQWDQLAARGDSALANAEALAAAMRARQNGDGPGS